MGKSTALRAEDLLTIPDPPDGAHYELSRGELITVPGAGYRHEYVKTNILEHLFAWNLTTRAGRVFSESMFRLDDETARKPDVAFVTAGRIAGVPVEDTLISFVPNIAVEVISKSEIADEAERKVREYLAAGVTEVWQVFPEFRVVHVRTTSAMREVQAGQTLESSVLPGFVLPISELFD